MTPASGRPHRALPKHNRYRGVLANRSRFRNRLPTPPPKTAGQAPELAPAPELTSTPGKNPSPAAAGSRHRCPAMSSVPARRLRDQAPIKTPAGRPEAGRQIQARDRLPRLRLAADGCGPATNTHARLALHGYAEKASVLPNNGFPSPHHHHPEADDRLHHAETGQCIDRSGPCFPEGPAPLSSGYSEGR